MTCNSCGGDVLSSEKVCKYCGAENPGYADPKKVQSPPPSSSSYRPQSSSSYSGGSFNWITFLVLAFVFFPAAIIYAFKHLKDR